jgi:hypothetical protein
MGPRFTVTFRQMCRKVCFLARPLSLRRCLFKHGLYACADHAPLRLVQMATMEVLADYEGDGGCALSARCLALQSRI